jgi:competence protein ComEC
LSHRIPALACLLALALVAAPRSDAAGPDWGSKKDLRFSIVDVEGGAATVFVTPDGKSLLIDTGWPPGMGNGPMRRGGPPPAPTTSSADRIAAAAAALGVTHIDYLLLTHYHADHAGGVDALLEKLPADTFIDHGPNGQFAPPNAPARFRNSPFSTEALYKKWAAAYKGHPHISEKLGQSLNIGSLHIKFVASNGHLLNSPLPGAGQPNPLCAGVQPDPNDGGLENVLSLGMLMTYGKTSILDLGDNTWNNELKLLCPVNKIGKVDVYFVTGHGMNLSSSPPTAALAPLVALMQNGPRKGGDEAVLKTVESFPGLEGRWMSHYSVRYPALNPNPDYIANLDVQPDQAYPIDVDIASSGKITVINPRNGFTKTYWARAAGRHARK